MIILNRCILITKYISIFAGIMTVISGLLFWAYSYESERRIKAETALETVKFQMERQRSDFLSQVSKNDKLNAEFLTLRNEYDKSNSELNGYRDREKLLQKRPESIERLANAATMRVFNDICSASGGCSKDNSAETGTYRAD